MNAEIFNKEIRFALYEQYSKLDKEVAEIFTKLDKKIEEPRVSFVQYYHNYQVLSDECSEIYSDLIKTINIIIDSQRERTQLIRN